MQLEKLTNFIRVLTGKPSTLASWVASSVILGISDPFDMSDTVGLAGRLAYWIVLIGVALQLATLLHLVFPRLYLRVGAIVSRLILGAVFAAIFGPFVFAFNALFYPERYETMMAWPQLIGFLFLIFGAIGIVMDAVSYQFTGKLSGAAMAENAEHVEVEPRPEPDLAPKLPVFMDRLEKKLGTDLMRLSMQDHYVEAHTERGSQLILMRLVDAVKELQDVEGLQVHRSHWVASAHVSGVQREQGRLSIVMQDGAVVPVSRSFRANVKAAGLLG